MATKYTVLVRRTNIHEIPLPVAAESLEQAQRKAIKIAETFVPNSDSGKNNYHVVSVRMESEI